MSIDRSGQVDVRAVRRISSHGGGAVGRDGGVQFAPFLCETGGALAAEVEGDERKETEALVARRAVLDDVERDYGRAGRDPARLALGKLAAFGALCIGLMGVGPRPSGSSSILLNIAHEEAPHAYGTVAVPMIASLSLLLVAGRAAGSITAERERDTWLTLISTPLTGREIVWAKFSAAIYSVRYWYLVIAAGLVAVYCGDAASFWAVPLLMIVHLSVLSITAAIGVLCSLASKTSLRAMGPTLAILVLVLSIGPLFIAAITRSEEFTGFSLPVTLGVCALLCCGK